MAKNRYKQAKKVFSISLGARCREFESPISAQDVLMKDATQKTPHESAVFLYLYWLFSGGKVRKHAGAVKIYAQNCLQAPAE